MEKQTTVLFSVALLKNQEKTQGRIQTTNGPRQQQQQNLERQHTQHHSIHKQHLPRSTTIWTWNFSTERQITKQQRILFPEEIKIFCGKF